MTRRGSAASLAAAWFGAANVRPYVVAPSTSVATIPFEMVSSTGDNSAWTAHFPGMLVSVATGPALVRTIVRANCSRCWRAVKLSTTGSRMGSLAPMAGLKTPAAKRAQICTSAATEPREFRGCRWIITKGAAVIAG
eukprot:scaffold289547_cov28-Tisochrysis_lutea.AAC.2